jgi:uncharacterized membrane protein HdeD (DUF308 family)
MITEVEHVGRNWWLFVILGAVCIITGILAIVWPGLTLLTLGILAGIYLMVAAIMEIIDAITGDPGGRALSAILGIISLIAGLIFIRRPGESLLAIVIVAGIFLISEGVIRVVRAFSGPGTRWWGVAAGLFDAVAGIIILAWPGIGLVTLAVFFAVTMVVRGALAIVLGLKIRNLKDLIDEPPVNTVRATTA